MKIPHFYRYSKSQRLGIIALFSVIIFLQAGYYVFTSVAISTSASQSAEEKEWLSHQADIDALKTQYIAKDTIYPFNPNYITDYKGYTLGMTDEQIDRLLAYRKSGKWINSTADFKLVTGVSDSLLNEIGPYFKFPDWVAEKYGGDVAQKDNTDYESDKNDKVTIYPFNPNFMSDQVGGKLGMTKEQIGRLKAYRDSGKWINTPADFKMVTGISDALLSKISPYFKFPDWVVRKYQSGAVQPVKKSREPNGPPKDINTALEEDLTEIYGIGPTSAKKIMRRRAALGAFVDMEQMADFKDFSSKAIAGLKKGFMIGTNPDVTKVNVNTATVEQLARFPYFNEEIAKAIITQRTTNGKIRKFDDLLKINDIFTLKSKIIRLYLEY